MKGEGHWVNSCFWVMHLERRAGEKMLNDDRIGAKAMRSRHIHFAQCVRRRVSPGISSGRSMCRTGGEDVTTTFIKRRVNGNVKEGGDVIIVRYVILLSCAGIAYSQSHSRSRELL